MLEILTNTGRESSNTEVLDMCEIINTSEKFIAANSTSSNGLVRQHSLKIADMLNKKKKNPILMSTTKVHDFPTFQLTKS